MGLGKKKSIRGAYGKSVLFHVGHSTTILAQRDESCPRQMISVGAALDVGKSVAEIPKRVCIILRGPHAASLAAGFGAGLD